MIGTCASGAAEAELCVVRVLSVDRIDRIVLTFLLSEAGYNFEHLVCFSSKRVIFQFCRPCKTHSV